jgi:nitroreductase
MNVSEAIRRRRSVRAYLDRPVEEEKLLRVLEAARLAPSARNMQEWKFVVVRDAERRKQLAEAARSKEFVAQAPVLIAACATVVDSVMTCGQLTYPIDLAIAIDHMTLQAVEEGLGTCWLGAFFEDQAKAAAGVPEDLRVVALLPLGYPDESVPGREKSRKALEEIVCWEKWS